MEGQENELKNKYRKTKASSPAHELNLVLLKRVEGTTTQIRTTSHVKNVAVNLFFNVWKIHVELWSSGTIGGSAKATAPEQSKLDNHRRLQGWIVHNRVRLYATKRKERRE